MQPRRILSDRQGNFGILTALIMVPLLGCAGMAIDFTNALRIRSQLMDAADSAALWALTEQSTAGKRRAAVFRARNGSMIS